MAAITHSDYGSASIGAGMPGKTAVILGSGIDSLPAVHHLRDLKRCMSCGAYAWILLSTNQYFTANR